MTENRVWGKRTIGIVILIIMIGSSVLSSLSVSGYLFKGTIGEMQMSTREQYQRTVYSNYSNRFYMFFNYFNPNIPPNDWIMVYAHSYYGYTFESAHSLWNNSHGNPVWGNVYGDKTFDFYLEPNGRYIHFAFRNGTTKGWYWKMEINATTGQLYPLTNQPQRFIENVGWEGSWRLVDEISIVADSEGYPFIGGECYDGATQYSYWVWECPNNDGTWANEVFTKHAIEFIYIALGGANPPNNAMGGELMPLNDNNILLIWWYYNQPAGQQLHIGLFYNDTTSAWAQTTGGLFNDNEGGDWAENCWSTGYSLEANSSSGLTVFFKQHESNPDGQIGLEAKILDHTTMNWGSNFQVSFDEAGDAGSTVFNPFVTMNENGSIIFVWTISGNKTYWARRMYQNGTLENWYEVEDMFNDMIEDAQFSGSDTALGDSPMPIQMMDDIGGQQVNTTITPLSGSIYQGWIYRGERYQIESYVMGASTYQINFTDGVHEISFKWDNSSKRLYVENDLNRELVIGLFSSDYTEYSDGTQYFKWEFILDLNIHDYLNTPFNYSLYHEESNSTINGDTGLTANIYSLGAIVSYDFDGDAGRTVGGDALEVHHTNSTGNGGLVEVIYRRLQHAHLAFSLDVDDNDCFNLDENSAVIQIGIKYLNNTDNWVDGWYAEMSIPLGAIILGGAGGGNAWIRPNVAWYARDTDGNVNNIKSDTITGYPNAGNKINEDITDTDFYVDLWFNTMNSSTTIGGRFSSKYYGMKETGWLLWTNWSPLRTNVSESMFFYDLLDPTGNITQPIDIELMKFWVRVLKSGNGAGSCDTHTWRISVPELSVTLAGDRMEALNTPDGIDTLVIDMPSGGWMQPITKAIQGIGNAFSKAMFGVVKILIGALDTLLVDVLHSPVSMSQMIDWIMIQSNYITDWMVEVLARVSDMLEVFTNMVTFVLQIVDRAVSLLIWVSVNVIGFPLVVLNMFIEIGRDGVFTLYGVTYDWSSGHGLVQGFLVLLPTFLGWWLVMWVLYNDIHGGREIDIQGAPRRMLSIFGWMKEIFENVFWVFNRMRNEIISLYNFIRSHIPQIGGGGGETAE
jgi:hypothetical protein